MRHYVVVFGVISVAITSALLAVGIINLRGPNIGVNAIVTDVVPRIGPNTSYVYFRFDPKLLSQSDSQHGVLEMADEDIARLIPPFLPICYNALKPSRYQGVCTSDILAGLMCTSLAIVCVLTMIFVAIREACTGWHRREIRDEVVVASASVTIGGQPEEGNVPVSIPTRLASIEDDNPCRHALGVDARGTIVIIQQPR
jgi:hypothetical protein